VSDALLEVQDLRVTFGGGGRGREVHAVDGVSYCVYAGQTLAVVGESGSGKTVSCRAVMGLLPPSAAVSGSARFQGVQLIGLTDEQLREHRGANVAMVFQDPARSLNPTMRIGTQIAEAIRTHHHVSKAEAREQAVELLRLVHMPLPGRHCVEYPHQLSGGMRQRSMIAMAMLFTPDLIIMDEPTSALDVVAQRSLMVQIKELQLEFGFAVIFVTHDMSLISHFSDRLMVMYGGQVAELGATKTIFDRPLHPYTQGLLEAFPSIRGPRVPLKGIPGNPPDLSRVPSGCRFRPRCPYAIEKCAEIAPDLYPLDGALVRCLRREDGSLA
jgi:peptide/nickel transport system ATP-binding protein